MVVVKEKGGESAVSLQESPRSRAQHATLFRPFRGGGNVLRASGVKEPMTVGGEAFVATAAGSRWRPPWRRRAEGATAPREDVTRPVENFGQPPGGGRKGAEMVGEGPEDPLRRAAATVLDEKRVRRFEEKSARIGEYLAVTELENPIGPTRGVDYSFLSPKKQRQMEEVGTAARELRTDPKAFGNTLRLIQARFALWDAMSGLVDQGNSTADRLGEVTRPLDVQAERLEQPRDGRITITPAELTGIYHQITEILAEMPSTKTVDALAEINKDVAAGIRARIAGAGKRYKELYEKRFPSSQEEQRRGELRNLRQVIGASDKVVRASWKELISLAAVGVTENGTSLLEDLNAAKSSMSMPRIRRYVADGDAQASLFTDAEAYIVREAGAVISSISTVDSGYLNIASLRELVEGLRTTPLKDAAEKGKAAREEVLRESFGPRIAEAIDIIRGGGRLRSRTPAVDARVLSEDLQSLHSSPAKKDRLLSREQAGLLTAVASGNGIVERFLDTTGRIANNREDDSTLQMLQRVGKRRSDIAELRGLDVDALVGGVMVILGNEYAAGEMEPLLARAGTSVAQVRSQIAEYIHSQQEAQTPADRFAAFQREYGRLALPLPWMPLPDEGVVVAQSLIVDEAARKAGPSSRPVINRPDNPTSLEVLSEADEVFASLLPEYDADSPPVLIEPDRMLLLNRLKASHEANGGLAEYYHLPIAGPTESIERVQPGESAQDQYLFLVLTHSDSDGTPTHRTVVADTPLADGDLLVYREDVSGVPWQRALSVPLSYAEEVSGARIIQHTTQPGFRDYRPARLPEEPMTTPREDSMYATVRTLVTCPGYDFANIRPDTIKPVRV